MSGAPRLAPVSPALRLLDDVSWRGAPLAGDRPAALLAALTLTPAGVSDSALIDVVWGDDRPANPTKALQVLVSRVRSQCGSEVLVRHGNGYRLGVGHDDVDALLIGSLLQRGAARLAAGDPAEAATLAAEALELTAADDEMAEGPLAEVRSRARRTANAARRLLGLALVRSGSEREAIEHLRAVADAGRDDAEVLEALLRAEAVVSGPPEALAHYEAYRADLRDRLGVDPPDALQRLHRELLAADEPLRTGIRYETDQLLGRTADLARLRAAVRSGRLTSIIGPGGIGKTRIAHVLAREATEARVHFVELVGISSPDDVVPEIGAALGVRDSVTSRRTHTPAQRADIRGRIAQELDTGPTLLVLDNCEHVVDAVASLVAFLLVTARDLRVVTTSRAPLNIGAEQVVLLDQLAAADGADLFVRRALAARPTAELDPALVEDVVGRLDGLPLAIELAAARIRTMSLEELRQRLEDRFAVLRGRDRSAPARHQTLTAVIGWSWDLLGPPEQQALAWLSVFHDGFGIGSAESVLGPDAMDLVDALVDQSLLSVSEADGIVHYRMLETVREFGTQRLAQAGEAVEALAAQSRWAVEMADRLRGELFGLRQVAAVDELSHEENNLADVLRRAMAEDDATVAVPLVATLGTFWAITGNNPRVFAIVDGTERLLERWQPPPDLIPATQVAISILVSHMGFFQDRSLDAVIAAMARLGPPDQPWARATYAMFVEASSEDERIETVLRLADEAEPATAIMALQWAANLAENEGLIDDARTYTERALSRADGNTTPWQLATLHTQLALLAMQVGDPRAAAVHAEFAWPLLVRLHAHDDAVQVRAGMAMGALQLGDVGECERLLAEMRQMEQGQIFGGHSSEAATRAELALAKGDIEGGLTGYLVAVKEMGALRFPGMDSSGLEPWTMVAEAAALIAHVRYAETRDQLERRDRIAEDLLDKGARLLDLQDAFLDFPVTGMMLAAVGAWLLDRPDADHESAVRLLVMARCFAYNRTFPVMAWEPLARAADRELPGRLAVLLDEYDGRPGRELVGEVADLLAGIVARSGK
jgi:predicted ATPase/DNA-binding SARP family transcriptional activator